MHPNNSILNSASQSPIQKQFVPIAQQFGLLPSASSYRKLGVLHPKYKDRCEHQADVVEGYTRAPLADVPDELKDWPNWVCYRLLPKNGKTTKVPVDPKCGQLAKSNDSTTWSTFETAVAYANEHGLVLPDGTPQVGFVFTDSPFAGIDFDAVDDTTWQRVQLLNSYTEHSPSGTGLHVIVKGSLPKGRRRVGTVEVYDDKRFFTVTGHHVKGSPPDVKERTDELALLHEQLFPKTKQKATKRPALPLNFDDDAVLALALNASNGHKVRRLWAGDWSNYNGLYTKDGRPEGASRADYALINLLAFYTTDRAQLVRLLNASGLRRDKFDERHAGDGRTYIELSVDNALKRRTAFYAPRQEKTDTKRQRRLIEFLAVDVPVPVGELPERVRNCGRSYHKVKGDNLRDIVHLCQNHRLCERCATIKAKDVRERLVSAAKSGRVHVTRTTHGKAKRLTRRHGKWAVLALPNDQDVVVWNTAGLGEVATLLDLPPLATFVDLVQSVPVDLKTSGNLGKDKDTERGDRVGRLVARLKTLTEVHVVRLARTDALRLDQDQVVRVVQPDSTEVVFNTLGLGTQVDDLEETATKAVDGMPLRYRLRGRLKGEPEVTTEPTQTDHVTVPMTAVWTDAPDDLVHKLFDALFAETCRTWNRPFLFSHDAEQFYGVVMDRLVSSLVNGGYDIDTIVTAGDASLSFLTTCVQGYQQNNMSGNGSDRTVFDDST